MQQAWEKPTIREIQVNGECTAYAGADGEPQGACQIAVANTKRALAAGAIDRSAHRAVQSQPARR